MTADRRRAIDVLAEMIADVHVVMLTTVAADGSLRSRPMVRAGTEFQGDLWFFTDQPSAKIDDILGNPQVNVSYADAAKRCFISMSGIATIVLDRKNIELLWEERLRQWLPHSPDAGEISLVKVNVQSAEYWNPPASIKDQVGGLVKGILSGRLSLVDDHEEIDWTEDS